MMDDKKERERLRARVHARRRRQAILRALILLAAFCVLGALTACVILPGMSGQNSAEQEQTYTRVQAQSGTIERTVFGSGTVQPASQPGVYAAIDATVGECYVEMGDSVKAGDVLMRLENDELEAEISTLASEMDDAQSDVRTTQTHTQYVYRQLYDEDGDARFDVNTDEPLLGQFSNEITIYAPCEGRIMAIYIEPGDDALAVYREKGAVAMISTDGRMKVELSGLDGTQLALGDKVCVTGEGIDAEGVVVSLTRRGTEAVVQVNSDEYPMDTPVTVTTAEGEAVGEGVLEINKPMAVSAYGGTIKGISVKVGDYVKREAVIARIVWDDIPLYLDNAQVLRDYVKAKVAYEEAVSKREALTIIAPCDGKVASVSVESGDKVTDGTQLLSIVEDAGMTLILQVDELDITSVEAGQTVSISVDALPDVALTGTVEKIAPLGNTETVVTTYDVYIELGEVDERVLGGMNVSGEIVVDTAQDALLIPTDALRKDADGYYVLLEDGSAQHVTVGIMTDDRVEITDGLYEGQTVLY